MSWLFQNDTMVNQYITTDVWFSPRRVDIANTMVPLGIARQAAPIGFFWGNVANWGYNTGNTPAFAAWYSSWGKSTSGGLASNGSGFMPAAANDSIEVKVQATGAGGFGAIVFHMDTISNANQTTWPAINGAGNWKRVLSATGTAGLYKQAWSGSLGDIGQFRYGNDFVRFFVTRTSVQMYNSGSVASTWRTGRIPSGGQVGRYGVGFGINGTWSTTYRNVVVFARDSTDIGYLQINNTNYQFVNASDHRLKTNVRDLSNAWQYLDAMQVRRFNWVLDPDGPKQCGFIAHELAEVIPLAVSGEKDAVDRQGQPEHQNLNLKKVVPVLTAGIRDLQNRVAQLRAQVNQ